MINKQLIDLLSTYDLYIILLPKLGMEKFDMPHLPASDALSHIRVIDLTRVRSGPTAVRQLADWGADVIKVEAHESV